MHNGMSSTKITVNSPPPLLPSSPVLVATFCLWKGSVHVSNADYSTHTLVVINHVKSSEPF